MSSWLSVILITFILLAIIYFYLRKQNKLPSFLSNFFAPNTDKIIESLNAQTKIELDKMAELREVLAAKEKLSQVQAINTNLRKRISTTTESRAVLSKEVQNMIYNRKRDNGKIKT